MKPTSPFIPGYEGVGIIERVGPGNAHGLTAGMRVGLPWLGYACSMCRHCNTGWETFCESQINTGYGMNGGFADEAIEQVLDGSAPAPHLVFRRSGAAAPALATA